MPRRGRKLRPRRGDGSPRRSPPFVPDGVGAAIERSAAISYARWAEGTKRMVNIRPATARPKDEVNCSGVHALKASAMEFRNARARLSLSPSRAKVMRGGPMSEPSRRKLKRAVAESPSVPCGGFQQAMSAGPMPLGVLISAADAAAVVREATPSEAASNAMRTARGHAAAGDAETAREPAGAGPCRAESRSTGRMFFSSV